MIVRELVTKLGFQYDRTNLDKFEKSIIGFKTKFTIAGAAVAGFFKKVLDFSSEFANASIAASDIAKYSGIALKDFKALQLVAEKFNIDETSFNNLFQNISLGIKEASQGVDNFIFQLTRQTQGIVNFRKLNGELTNARDLFLQIGHLIRQIPDQSERLRILSNIPGIGIENAGKFERLLSQSNDQILRQISLQEEVAAQFEKSLPGLQVYQNSINSLGVEYKKLATTIGSFVVPILGKVLGGFNDIIDTLSNKGFKQFTEELGGAVRTTGNQLNSFIEWLTGINLQGLENPYGMTTDPYARMLKDNEIRNSNNNTSSIITNNKFEFNVPPGTTEGQANVVAEMVKMSIESTWNEKIREVINNNPTVE
jgi:hypothetical protein